MPNEQEYRQLVSTVSLQFGADVAKILEQAFRIAYSKHRCDICMHSGERFEGVTIGADFVYALEFEAAVATVHEMLSRIKVVTSNSAPVTPVVDEARFNPNFRNVCKNWSPHDKALLSCWADGFVDRDRKFVKEFQTTFNACFWELYLFACLKHLELRVDFKHTRPDFVIDNFLDKFCIEAAIASNAKDQPSEWERKISDIKNLKRKRIVDEATIRLANTLVAKHQKFVSEYHELPHVKGKPFVLAIAPFEQPHFEVQNDQAMRRVLYAYDRPVCRGKRLIRHEYIRSIRKKSGTEISLGFFLDQRMREISAVIFSNTATAGKVRALSDDPSPNIWFRTLRFNKNGQKPLVWGCAKPDYYESLLDGLHVFHNPNARYPLPWDLFNKQGVSQHTYVTGHPWPPFKTTHGALNQRTVVTLRIKD